MSTSHRPQHRQKRESKEVSAKEHAELKSENHRLRRQIARLIKQQSQQKAMYENYIDTEEMNAMEEQVDQAKTQIEEDTKCPSCSSSDYRVLDLGLKLFNVCGSCLHRQPA